MSSRKPSRKSPTATTGISNRLHLEVPKDLAKNLEYREFWRKRSINDRQVQQAILRMSASNLLWWVNTWVWTYNPKDFPENPVRPFITWSFQDPAFLEINSVIGVEDIATEKSRDMGLSWMMLLVMTWRWLVKPYQTFLLVSRNEDLVDKKNEPDCLFWKIDFALDNLPGWMRPNFDRQKLSLKNLDNGSMITGASTTGETARGGRKTAIMLDEFASVLDDYAMLKATRDATNSRLFNSTPKGSGNAFYDITHNTPIRKLRFHWTLHPHKSAGTYIDKNGKARSPWYDRQCERAAHPMEIAQELDIDYLGSDFQFFDGDCLEVHRKLHVMPAYYRGNISYDEGCSPIEFVPGSTGPLSLWLHTDLNMPVVGTDRRYTIGVDIATGTGSSNTSMVVGDNITGEQVAEYAEPNIRPEDAARLAVALSKWFNGALLIWEANGPGRNFGDRVLDLGYRNIYYRRNDASITARISDFPGWYSTKETKIALMGSYRRAIVAGEFIIRSQPQIDECREFIYTATGGIEHARSLRTIDPSGARDNHGDRPTAGALCWKGMERVTPLPAAQPEVPIGSLAYRRQKRERAERAEVYNW